MELRPRALLNNLKLSWLASGWIYPSQVDYTVATIQKPDGRIPLAAAASLATRLGRDQQRIGQVLPVLQPDPQPQGHQSADRQKGEHPKRDGPPVQLVGPERPDSLGRGV